MHIINFAHPLTDAHLAQTETLTTQKIERVIHTPLHFDSTQSFIEQMRVSVAAIELTTVEWQTLPLLVNPPALSIIAVLVLAELHGRTGYFPAVLRLREVAGSTLRQFEVAEILNLQQVRDTARKER